MSTDVPKGLEVIHELAKNRGLDKAMELLATFDRYSPEELADLREQYEALVQSVEQGYPPKIFAGVSRKPWYPGPLSDDGHWPRLRESLIAKNGQERVDILDAASSKIIAHTADVSEDKWHCRGLVIGNVQSGKTENFTAVIAKAVDVSYNLIIVLSGIHNGLRSQTQKRLVSDLVSLTPAGWYELTTADDDFRTPIIKPDALFQGNVKPAVICVVKKNHAVLGKLNRWLRQAKRNGALKDVRALIIDDEADQASVETARINPYIREINGHLARCTFIGYTATPYANVLIDPDPKTDDLYPKDFILALPTADRYFGSEKIFGRDDLSDPDGGEPVDGYDMVREVDEAEARNFRPRKNEVFTPEIEGRLAEATRWFLLATAARKTRPNFDHSTMLIHTSMRVAVHEAFRDPLIDFLTSQADGLAANDDEVERTFEELWSEETTKVPAAGFPGLELTTPVYADVRSHLEAVARETRVILDNSTSPNRLDYDSGPVTAIAVGGNTLSRGLTLEGLTVSYFVRSAKAYDTLMQMGRWFGYRIGYEDLPRIYMTKELRNWFRHMSSVEQEIRQEADYYGAQALTPMDYGMRIRTHPSLLVTQKLGAARLASTSFGGRRIQVRYFHRTDEKWLADNAKAADDLVREIEHAGIIPNPAVQGGPVLWEKVPVKYIQDFLSEYQVHDESPELNRENLLRYIDGELQNGSLVNWNVAVMANTSVSKTRVPLGSSSYDCIIRSQLKDNDPTRADIKTLMSKEHRAIDDLGITQTAARKLSEADLALRRNEDPVLRNRGLLLLYPIDPKSPPSNTEKLREDLDAKGDVIGLALVFPGNAEHSVRNNFIAVVPPAYEEPEDEDPDDGDDTNAEDAGHD